MALKREDDIRVEDYYYADGCDDNNIKSFTWERNPICWDNNPFCWDDVSLVVQLSSGIQEGLSWIESYDKLDETKKRRFVKLVAKVRGKTFEKQKEIRDIKLTANDIKITVETVLKTVQVENINVQTL